MNYLLLLIIFRFTLSKRESLVNMRGRVILFSVQRSKFKRKNFDRIYRMNMIFQENKENAFLLLP